MSSKRTKAGRRASFLQYVGPQRAKMLWRMSPAGWMVPYVAGTPDPIFHRPQHVIDARPS